MKSTMRTFSVIELGKPVSTMDIRLPVTDTVEVVDLVTSTVSHVSAAEVSIYRHTLHLQGRSFRIMNVCDSF